MPSLTNRQYRLAARPTGVPKHSDWTFLNSEPVPTPEDGQVLVKVLQLSLDPAMRAWMNDVKSYIPPVAIGEVMRAGGVGIVLESRHPNFIAGDHVAGVFGVQDYCLVDLRAGSRASLQKIDLRMGTLSQWLNSLGIPGITAYFGLLDVGQAKAGDTVVVSAAAGAVGQTVGQVAKLTGCRVVGIAGGAAKCEFVVRELGFDACIDYKAGDVAGGLKQHCPGGVDVYFDNVGGPILDAVLARINRRARIVICGAVSQYNNTGPTRGPSNYMMLLVQRARMEGMVIFDYADRYPQAVQALAGWLKTGQLRSREDIVDGLERFPEALNRLFSGENFGKLVLGVASE